MNLLEIARDKFESSYPKTQYRIMFCLLTVIIFTVVVFIFPVWFIRDTWKNRSSIRINKANTLEFFKGLKAIPSEIRQLYKDELKDYKAAAKRDNKLWRSLR